MIVYYYNRLDHDVRVIKDSFVVGKMTTVNDIFDQIGALYIPANEIISINIIQD